MASFKKKKHIPTKETSPSTSFPRGTWTRALRLVVAIPDKCSTSGKSPAVSPAKVGCFVHKR